MSIVNTKEMLLKARNERYCVGAFDASTAEMAHAVIEAAEELRAPVIIMGLTPDLKGIMLDCWISTVRILAENASVPVAIHLDHSTDMDLLKECVDKGFTSVMYDASVLPFEENVRLSAEAAEYAHAAGCTVEAELGHVGDGIISGELKNDAEYDDPDDHLTDPAEMKEFIEKTGVDMLAVAVGTAHGVYVKKPELKFDRLEELNSLSTVPLVLHGGSGTPEDQVKRAIELGICKLNIYSEIVGVYYTELKKKLDSAANMNIWVSRANEEPLKALKQVVEEKIMLTGSAGKA
ncbi:MAG: class II fructose-bisphosphate aldolase [Lachnospiraceae bacterium]|nr:class II fructose-bisphosphate aldolase [Lachnospiraceae bacterium]